MKDNRTTKIKTTLTKNQLAKQKCVEKLSNFLIKKYGNLFKDKSYSNKQLIEDLSSNLKDKDIQSFNLNSFLVKFEKIILEKVSKCESKQSLGLEMNQIKDLLPKQKEIESPMLQPIRQKSSPHSKPITTLVPQNIKVPEDKSVPYATDKMERLRRKENDEWAIKAKKEHEKYLVEEQEKKKVIEEGKRKQKEMLEQQIKEKEIQKQKEKKDEYDLYIKNNSFNQIGNGENSRPNQIISQQSNMNNNKAITNNKPKTQEQLNDNKYYEQLKKDILKEENIEKEKRQKQRELQIQIQKDNEANSLIKRQLKQQEKEQQKDFIFNVKDPFTENNKEDSNNKDISTRPKSSQQQNRQDIPIQSKEKNLHEYEEKKLMREMKEKEALEKQREEEKKSKKKDLMEQFKQGLNAQVNEKKRLQKERESTKQQELVDSKKINELYNKDIKKNSQDKIDKINQYRQLLDMQVNTKAINE